jgi:signal transduction histidine kinase
LKAILHSFYGKISLVFLFILLALGIILSYLTITTCINMIDEVRQKLNSPIARNVAKVFEPLFLKNVDADSIRTVIDGMMLVNPEIEIHFLDDHGNILDSFVPPGGVVKMKKVDLMPIKKFLENPYDIHCVGDAPCKPGMQMLFSAAPIRYTPTQSGYVYVVLGVKQYHNAISLIRNSYIGRSTIQVLTITLLFTAIIGLILFGMITRRFQRMTQIVNEFANGNLDQRIEITSHDEIGQLAAAFNQMADTIQHNIWEISEKEQHRRDLIANISHDLRSPLASIQGYLETILMKDQQITDAQRKRMLETIFKNALQLNRLVNELFEFSKLDAQQVQPQIEPFSIAELTHDIILKFKPVADQRNIRLQLVLPRTSLPLVLGDIGMIERALSNLIDNALNYTPPGGTVMVTVEKKDHKVCVRITDTGKGIPEADLPHIFERFYRVEKSRSRQSEPGGAGLGLAITKKILEAHNSEITVKSELGKGTEFEFALPIVDKLKSAR